MKQLILIAVRNLLQHRRRTLLLGGAIAGVTALLVFLLGLSNGIRATMLESATTLMTGHVNVGGFYKVTAGQSGPMVTGYPKILELVQREVPEIEYVTQRGRGWAKLISDTGSMQVGIAGVDLQGENGIRKVLKVKSGALNDLSRRGTLLLFEEQAKKLAVKVGDTLTLSAPTFRGVNNTLDVRLVAIAHNVGLLSAWNIFISGDSLRELYQLKPDVTGALQLYLKNIHSVPSVQAHLRSVLEKAGYRVMDNDPRAFWMKFETVNRENWVGQKLDITNWEDEISFIKWTLTALDGLTGALIFVLLVIIAIGIMNTLWISIRERTREIGTLRAIGMQRSGVLKMFLLEGFCLSLLGTGSGALAGIALCFLINALHLVVPLSVQLFVMSEQLHLSVKPSSVASAVALITLCTTAISLVPSLLAARLKPVTAMNHIG